MEAVVENMKRKFGLLVIFIFIAPFLLGTHSARAGESSNIVITEIMNHWPADADRRIVVTRVNRSDSGPSIELLNPFDTRLRIRKVSLDHSARESLSLDTTLESGQRFVVCSSASCSRSMTRRNVRHDRLSFQLKSTDGIRVLSSPAGNHDGVGSDAVGWGNVASMFREDIALDSGIGSIRRRVNPSGCPIDTQSNSNDFVKATSKWSGEPRVSCSGTVPADRNEYVEIYNAGDVPVDPVKEGYRITDRLDRNGNSVDRWYRIVGFPHYPHTEETTLEPGQVGLILRPGADTLAFSDLNRSTLDSLENPDEALEGTLYKDFSEGDVKLYTTERNGNLMFLTDGLHDSTMERLTLERPGTIPPEVNILRKGYDWYPPDVKPFHARVKDDPVGPNIYRNWTRVKWGSPGRVNN